MSAHADMFAAVFFDTMEKFRSSFFSRAVQREHQPHSDDSDSN